MSEHDTAVSVLARGLGQLGRLLEEVPADRLGDPTPCTEWTLRDLVDHAVQMPGQFAGMVRGEEVSWGAQAPHHDDWSAAYRRHADALLQAWSARPDAQAAPDFQTAEVAVHTWDVATALDQPTADLDQEVAERGLAFLRRALTEDNRAPVFAPERSAPPGADAYQRIAAFAGREV